jgi:SnoaL-like protein
VAILRIVPLGARRVGSISTSYLVGRVPRAAQRVADKHAGWVTRPRALPAVAVCLLVLAVVAWAAVLPQMRAQSAGGAQVGPDPRIVIDGFEQARNKRDVEAMLTFFADDATLTDRSAHVYQGKDEIRGYFQQFAARGRGLPLSVASLRINGPDVNWIERPAVANAVGFEIGVGAVVRDGKFRSVVYAAPSALGRVDPAADARAASGSLPALFGLVAVLLLLGTAAAVSSMLASRPVTGWESQLRGRLVTELATWRADRR